MKRVFRILGWTLLVVLVLGVAGYVWASIVANRRYNTAWDVRGSDFLIPFPLSESEVAELRAPALAANPGARDPLAGMDLQRIALERALERGRHLTPHDTGLRNWTEGDFIRALREGRRKDGTAISEMMPWRAYGQMKDPELKAIWAYLQTAPPLEKGNH